MVRRTSTIVAYVLVLVLGGFLAYYYLFTSFHSYDDEGYIVLSLRSFLQGGHLYDDVYSQYGPFYYELFGALFAGTGKTLTTDAGRSIVLLLWLGTATVYGLAVQRLTSRASVGLATLVVALGVLPFLSAEPMHPLGLVTLLLALLVAVVAFVPVGRALSPILLGALVGLLALTKINVGGLAFVAVVFAAAVTLPGLRERAAVRWSAIALLVLVPIAILFPDLGTEWVRVMATLVTGATLALGAASTTRVGEPDLSENGSGGGRFLLLFAGATAIAGALVAVVVLALGTSLHGLVHGIVLDPVRLREVYMTAFLVPTSSLAWAIGSALVAFAVRRARQARLGDVPRAWTGIVRVVTGLLTWLTVRGTAALVVPASPASRLVLPLAFAWLVVVPVGGRRPGLAERFARTSLAALAVLETVQAYPVAGTQTLVAAMVFVPCGALMLADGVGELEAVARARRASVGARANAVLVAGVLAAAILFGNAGLAQPLQPVHYTWTQSLPLQAFGATKVRLPPTQAPELNRLLASLRATCPHFITIPGLESFYLWTNTRPPTGYNTTDWMQLLDAPTQAKIVSAVRDQRDLCVVRNRRQLLGWDNGLPPPDRPLVRYIRAHFRPAERFLGGEYEILRRR